MQKKSCTKLGMRLYQLERLGLSKEPNLGNETFSTKMAHCAVPEILVNLYSMLGSSWNSIALGLNESLFWPYDYHLTHFFEKLIVLCIFRDKFCIPATIAKINFFPQVDSK